MESLLSQIVPLLTKAYGIFLGFIGISFLVGIHELGHFFCCKLFGVHTPSFSLGFGPRVYTKKIGDTEFSLSALPLGGYVEIAGMEEVGQGDQAHAHDRSQSSFSSKPYYQKMIIILGGIAVNMAFAWLALTLLFIANNGVPVHPAFREFTMTDMIEKVIPGSPAEQASIKEGDRLLFIDGHSPLNKGFIANELPKKAGQEVTLVFSKKGATTDVFTTDAEGNLYPMELDIPLESITATVTLSSEKGQPVLGVQFVQQKAYEGLSPLTAAELSLDVIKNWITSTFRSLANMFTRRTTSGLGGPIAVIHSITKSADNGWTFFVVALCFISVGIACLNLVPLPIFDGGQALFYTIEAITGRSFSNLRLWIHYISWISIMGLIVLLTWRDVVRIIMGS